MKNNIYLKAAKIQHKNGVRYSYGCCDSIKEATGSSAMHHTILENKVFTKTFKPNNSSNIFWYGHPNKENNLARTLGLLLMHEIVNSK